MKIAIYIRVSTQGQSLEQQVNSCQKYCEIKRWSDVEVFEEVKSATKERPVLKE